MQCIYSLCTQKNCKGQGHVSKLTRARPIGRNLWNSKVLRCSPRLDYQVLTVGIAYCSNKDRLHFIFKHRFTKPTRCFLRTTLTKELTSHIEYSPLTL